MFIYGYQFPCNSASTQLICSDKSALSEVLANNGIDCVEHEYVMSPSMLYYTGEDGIWTKLQNYLDKYKTIVVKRNQGSGGNGVYIVNNRPELERVTLELFQTCKSISVSPYYDYENEYRIIYCYNKPCLVYKKVRQTVVGDGVSSLAELTASKFKGNAEIADERLKPNCIPALGEVVNINWKHNLGQGASAEVLDTNSELYTKLVSIAKNTSDILSLNFASIDIIEYNGQLKLLEVNSGIMMENYSIEKSNYLVAKDIYKTAICNFFNM